MKYQCKRGGRIVYQDIAKPQKSEWASGLEAMETALKIEREVNDSLLALHEVASKHNDSQFCDFLECNLALFFQDFLIVNISFLNASFNFSGIPGRTGEFNQGIRRLCHQPKTCWTWSWRIHLRQGDTTW